MAQKILTEILKYYNIIPSVVQSATNTHLLQESAVDIPEGIPALLAYSENYSKRHSLEKTLMRSFLGRHAGTLTDLRLVVTACGLIYLSRPIIGPILSSAWEELSHDVDEWITGSNHNTDFEPHPKPETVSITVAELKELNNFADAIQVRLDEAKTRQEDLLTANCDLEDDVERLENDVEKLKRVAEDDAAHSDARIRALNDQIDIEKDSRVTVWNERERFRLGGKDLKKQLENLQAEYNELEDDRDEWREKAEEVALELQGELNEMTADRDSLQTTVTQLETDKQTLESSLAQKLADPKASDDRQAELEKSAAETAKALSDATTARQAQDKRIEELEAFKSQQEESAAKTAKALSDAAATKQAQDKRIEELEAFKSQKEKSEAEAESLAEKTDVQADLAAEDVEKADKGQIERLRVQLNVERASYRSVFRRKQIFRYGCKKLKKELEALQARCNELEDSQNTWKETCEALEKQTDVKAVKALRDQIASDNAHNERRIEALETQLGFEKSNREDAQKMARGLRDRVRELKDELKDAITENENLELSYEELDHMHGAEEKANEDKDEEITNLKAEYDRLEAKFTALNERNIQLNAEGTGTAETAAVEEEDESRQNDGTILQQPEDSKATDAEEEIPLRRVQSAPLWLPLPHHGDSFDLMYDVSDYGDDDRDQEYGNEDRDGHQGSHDDEHDSGNNDGDGPGEDDNNDDDEPDDGRNGGADKVATDADLAQEDHVANSPGLSDNTTSSNLPLNNGQPPGDLPVPESSLQRASFTMNASALDFVPSVCPKRPVPPILPQHQAYIASQQGVNSSDSGSGSPSPHPKFRIYSAAKPGTLSPEASFHGPIHYQDPFPQLYDSPALQCDQLPEHTPAPKAAGPQEAKNPHVQKLNKEVKRLEWRRMSGMPDFFEDEDKERKGNPLSDDDIGEDSSLASSELM